MLTKKQLILIILKNLGLVLVAISVSLFVVVYSSKQIAKISDSISEKKRVSFVLEKRGETYANLKNNSAMLGASDRVVEASLVPSDDISGFIGALETLGIQSGVTQSYQFGTPVISAKSDELTITSIDYSLKVGTNIYGLVAYLKNFESMPYLSGILNLNVSAGGARGLDDVSNISMNARLYVRQNI